MRTLLAGERTQIGAATVRHCLKVEVKDGDGTWQDWSSYVMSAQWGEDFQTAVSSATITLKRADGTSSLAPMMAASPLNVYSGGYAPAIEQGRRVRISTATIAAGTEPAGGDWREGFYGRVDTVNWAMDPITIECSDEGSWLMDSLVEAVTNYSNISGVAVETVMQNILNDWPSGMGIPTLYTPASPGWNIKTYSQERVKVLDAIRELAAQIGWDVRFRYDASHAFRLTFYDPDRDSVIVHDTIGPSEYSDVKRLDTSIVPIRNAAKVTYRKADGTMGVSTSQDTASITKYGRRYMELPSPKNVDALVQGDLYVQSAVNDLKDAVITQEVEMLFYWPVQLFDRYTFTANGVHYDSDQTLAVQGYSHTVQDGYGVTTLRCAGHVVGALDYWHKRIVVSPTTDGTAAPIITITQLAATTNGQAQYTVTVNVPATLYYAIGDDGYPGSSNLADGGTITVSRGTNTGDRNFLRVKAVASNGLTDERVLVVDYDTLPGLYVVDKVPLFSGNQPVGYRLKGTVDDDTRSLTFTITSALTLQTSTPAATLHSGTYWIDTSSTKTWQLDITQNPGTYGTVSLVARELSYAGGGGLSSPTTDVRCERAPVVTHTIREVDAQTREVIIAVNPASASIWYQVGTTSGGVDTMGSWGENIGGRAVKTESVLSSDTVFKYYATANGISSDVVRVVMDQDNIPGFVGGNPTVLETSNNILTCNIGVDDDVVRWRLWAKKGATPLVNGQPDDTYLRENTDTHKLSSAFSASNGTWYWCIRIYDKNGDYTHYPLSAGSPSANTVVVTGAVGTVPALSNTRYYLNTESSVKYIDVLWDYNTPAGTGHRIEIAEKQDNGSYVNKVVAGDARSPDTEHDGTSSPTGSGGWHIAVPWVAEGTSGAESHNYFYRVRLVNIATPTTYYEYIVAVPLWLAAGGGGGAAPTLVPNTAVASSSFPGEATANWTNTDSSNPIKVEWYLNGGLLDTVLLGSGVTTTGYYTGSGNVKFRVYYYNGYGDSTGGPPNYAESNTVTVL